jgi:hypothetical protein
MALPREGNYAPGFSPLTQQGLTDDTRGFILYVQYAHPH